MISLAILQGLLIKVLELALQSSHTVFSSFLLLISLMDSFYRVIYLCFKTQSKLLFYIWEKSALDPVTTGITLKVKVTMDILNILKIIPLSVFWSNLVHMLLHLWHACSLWQGLFWCYHKFSTCDLYCGLRSTCPQ